jgi:hypothetical protein
MLKAGTGLLSTEAGATLKLVISVELSAPKASEAELKPAPKPCPKTMLEASSSAPPELTLRVLRRALSARRNLGLRRRLIPSAEADLAVFEEEFFTAKIIAPLGEKPSTTLGWIYS